MTWGLIVRAESDRGLGVLTRLMHEHLVPDKTLVIRIDHEYAQEIEAFPGATVIDWAGGDLPEAEVRAWLDGLDSVVSAETFYDWNVINWARDMRVRTILYVMPELLKRELGNELPMPDQFWYPSSWRLSECPAGDLLPVPLEARRFVDFPDPTGPVKFIHVAGKPALGDRNGTQIVSEAVRRVRTPIQFTTYGQSLPRPQRLPHWHAWLNGPANKWEMYEQGHVFVLPRRYGGLSLPVTEALACGLAVVMPNISPNEDWPIVPLTAQLGRRYDMPPGKITTFDVQPDELTRTLNVLKNPSIAYEWMTASRIYANTHTWEQRKHLFMEALQ
jgi:hypothetical protein